MPEGIAVILAIVFLALTFALAYFYRKQARASHVAHPLQKDYSMFRALVENNQGIIALLDKNLNILFRSASGERITGWSNEEFTQLPVEHIHPDARERVKASMALALARPGMTIPFNHRLKHKKGYYIWLEGTVTNHLETPGIGGLVINLQDVTATKETEERLLKANRLYLFVNRINQAIVLAPDEQTLLADACRIAVEIGQFSMARIGLVDEAGSTEPVAHAGDGEATEKNNYSLPLRRSGTVVGLFSLYADKENFFDTDEVALLEGIAADISFAMDGFARDSELLQSKRHYQTLTEASPVGIFHTDASGWTTYVNPRWCQITGIKEEDALGNGWQRAVHPDDRAVLLREWESATAQKRASVAQYRFVNPEGKITWILGQAIPERGIHQEILGWVGTATDITRLKLAELQLEKSEENYRRAETLGRMGHWELDIQNNFLSWSDEIYRIFDIDHQAFTNRYQDFVQLIHPDDLAAFEKIHTGALKGLPMNFTHRIITRADALKYVHVLGELIQGENGQARYLTGTVQDITGQVIARNEVVNERNLSDSIINSLPGVFYLCKLGGEFLRWNLNYERVTGYSASEIRRMRPPDFFDTDEKELLRTKVANVFRSGEDYLEAHFMTKTGEKIPYFFTGKAIQFEGEPCMLGVGIDFSDKVKAEERLRETSEQLRELAAHLQHIREQERADIARDIHDDLGQQLTAVKIALYRLSRLEPAGEAMNKALNSIIDLVGNGIASIRRISTELRPGILDDLGLVEAMKWQIEEFEKRFSTPVSAEFSVVPPGQLNPEVSINTFRIFQETLTNIARHAEATRVEVHFRVDSRGIRLEVKDNGKGLPANGVKTKRTLGLLGMRERAHMIGGHLDINSRSGCGTTVSLEVPLT